MSWSATCPHCGTVFYDTNVFTNSTFVSPGMNVAVTCSGCGRHFDPTGGADGTYSTTGGRWRQVHTYLEGRPTEELEELRARLAEMERQRDVRQAADVVAMIGVSPPPGGWFANQANRNELWQIIGLISTLILGILALR